MGKKKKGKSKGNGLGKRKSDGERKYPIPTVRPGEAAAAGGGSPKKTVNVI